ncbi:MAG: XTP/dITP diphosphatase [Eubacteriales bacterium]|nr:XTP/dITP diphosphatase [Eubacteriales bacterium]
MEKVILASRNKGKLEEIKAILQKFGMETISRDDAGIPTFEVEETGSTFEENSLLKAQAIMDVAHVITIADDSGLEVDALSGAPGIYSARYAGENCTFEDNNRKLLQELDGVPEEQRGAAFVSVITMLFPNGEKLVARGECRGKILTELRGEEGFGYDPLFMPDGENRSFAEMTSEEKNRISHRAKSLQILEDMIRERDKN